MPFHSIEPRRLYRQIADQIRTLIKSGEFPAGARLPPERDLAKQLGVSRPSVREALIALEVEAWSSAGSAPASTCLGPGVARGERDRHEAERGECTPAGLS
jgi:DNA-binding transcriptional MocR family regulator